MLFSLEKAFYILVFYIPFSVALNPLPGIDLSSLRVFILILFGVVLIKAIIQRKFFELWRIFNNKTAIFLLLFLLIMFLSLLKAENIFWSLRKILFFISIFPLHFLTIYFVRSFVQAKKVIFALAGGAFFISLIGILQFFFQFIIGVEPLKFFWAKNVVPIFLGKSFGSLIVSNPSWFTEISGKTFFRAISLLPDPHILSFYGGLILPILLSFLIFGWKFGKIKFFIPTSYFFLLALLFLTFSRSAYMALIITFAVVFYLGWARIKENFKKSLFPVLGVGLAVIGILLLLIPVSPASDRFYSSFDLQDNSNLGRIEIWRKSLEIFKENILLGVGIGNFSLHIDPQVFYRNSITAHNAYLDIAAETGIFGLLIWLGLIWGSIWLLFKRFRSRLTLMSTPNYAEKEEFGFYNMFYVGLIGSLVWFSAQTLFDTAIYSVAVLAVLIVVLGLVSFIQNSKFL